MDHTRITYRINVHLIEFFCCLCSIFFLFHQRLAEKYDKAISDFEHIINEMPLDVSAYYLKGDCHFHKGEFDLAKRDYMRALKLQFDTKITDSSIETAIIIDEQDLKDIEKVLEYEKNQAILNYLPNLIAESD